MDKVRVCDLAKKYGIPSKELITFLNENNYEVKAAQSSVDEGAVKLADAHYIKSEEKVEPVKVEAPVAEEKKEEKTAEAPKKKKHIIIVNNSQNSKMPGDRRNTQNNGQRPNQGNNRPANAQNNNRVQPANAYRPLIKPLTPASPAPEVNMVKPGYRSNGEKMQQPREEKVQTNVAPQSGEKKPVMTDRNSRPERTDRFDRGERPQNQSREGRPDNRGENRGERGENRQDRGNRFNNNGQNRNGQGRPNNNFGPGKGFDKDKDKDERPQRGGGNRYFLPHQQ